MASNDDEIIPQSTKELTILSGLTARQDMDKHLESLLTQKISTLRLIDFNHFRKEASLFYPRRVEPNYILLVMDAIKENKYIQTLELDNEFTRPFKPISRTKKEVVLNLHELIEMTSLTHLILHNSKASPEFFQGLSDYLSDPACTLQVLELKTPIPRKIMEDFKAALSRSPNLNYYIGPDNTELQAILDRKVASRLRP